MSAGLMRIVMTHRATVERLTSDDTDRYDSPAWEEFATDLPCFLHSERSSIAVAPERTAVVDQMRVMVAKGSGLKGEDRFTSITRNGVEILSGVARIDGEPRDHHDHEEFALELVTGGA